MLEIRNVSLQVNCSTENVADYCTEEEVMWKAYLFRFKLIHIIPHQHYSIVINFFPSNLAFFFLFFNVSNKYGNHIATSLAL